MTTTGSRPRSNLRVLTAKLNAKALEEQNGVPIPDADDPHLTDLGNAKRLIARHGADLRYCQARGAWLVWDGRRWAWDESGEVERRAKETVLSWYGEAADLEKDDRKKLVNHAMKCEAAARLRSMVELARSEIGIPVSMADLDCDPWALNVENGTLDLRTGELRSHCRADLMTRLVPVSYDPLEECPRWLAFLRRIMAESEEKITFLQRAIGYSLTGSTKERLFFLLHGGGKNGKTKFLQTISKMLDDYGSRIDTDSLMEARNRGIPNDIARLKGARFVFASEGEEGKRLAEAKVKELSGGDTITARFMRGEWFDFDPEFKLWLGTNHRPNVRGNDKAIWDRIKLIPFTVRIPDEEQDKDLLEKLLAELPGILAWAVEGCLDWQREGLTEPDDVRFANEQYRSEEDVIGHFLDDKCEIGSAHQVTKKAMYAAYKAWCEDNGEKFVSQKKLSGLLKDHVALDEARMGSDMAHYWIGVSIREIQENNTSSSGRTLNA